MCGLDSAAVVLESKNHQIPLQTSRDQQMAILPAVGCLYGVLDQSEEELVQLVLMHPKGGQSLQVLGLKLQPCLSGTLLQQAKGPFRHKRDVYFDFLCLPRPSGQISKTLDHFTYPRARRKTGLEVPFYDFRAIGLL